MGVRNSRPSPLQLALPFPPGPAPRKRAAEAVARRKAHPGWADGRFGRQSAEELAAFVRSQYADRLERLFAAPDAGLRCLLDAVEAARDLGEAIDLGEAGAVKEAVETLRECRQDCPGGLSAAALLNALHLALFPELYEPDPDDGLDRRRAAERARKAAAEGPPDPAAVVKALAGMGGRLRHLADAGRAYYAGLKPDGRGLVPAGGGPRVGRDHVAALAGRMGPPTKAAAG